MFCMNCGTKLPEEALFCYKCGTPVVSDIAPDTSPPPEAISKPEVPKTPTDYYGTEIINGKKINILVILQTNNNDLAKAAKALKDLTAISTAEARSAVQAAYAKYRPPTIPPPITPVATARMVTTNRIAENRSQGVACCPKCGSASITGNKKGFGIGKAVVGLATVGGLGLVAGNLGARKIRVTCLNCGKSWMA